MGNHGIRIKPTVAIPVKKVWPKTLAMVAIALALAGCHDTPVQPEPVKYNIYVNVALSGTIYVVDADSLTVVDSIPDIGQALSMVSSPDGRWLYVQVGYAVNRPVGMLKIDMATKSVVEESAGIGAELSLLDEGELLLRWGEHCTPDVPTVLFDARDLSVLQTYTDSLCRHAGPLGGTQVSAVVNDGPNRVRIADLRTGAVSGSYTPILSDGSIVSITRSLVHPNGRWVLCLGRIGSFANSWFLVGDVDSDSTLIECPMGTPFGWVGLSSNGRWAVATNPGRSGFWDAPINIEFFDLRSLTHIPDSQFAVRTLPGQVQFLSGSNTAALMKDMGALTTGPIVIQLISLPDLSSRYAQIGSGQIGAMAVGVRYAPD